MCAVTLGRHLINYVLWKRSTRFILAKIETGIWWRKERNWKRQRHYQFNVEQIDWRSCVFSLFCALKSNSAHNTVALFSTHFLMPVNKPALSYRKGHERLRARLTHIHNNTLLGHAAASLKTLTTNNQPVVCADPCTSPRCIIIDFHTICKSAACDFLNYPGKSHTLHTRSQTPRARARLQWRRSAKKGRCAHR